VTRPTCLLAFEAPETCARRLVAAGMPEARAREVASYLDQAHDIRPELPALEAAFAARGLAFRAVPLDGLDGALRVTAPEATLVWPLTDGFAFFRGSAAPALALARGARGFGAPADLYFLAQDKHRSGAAMAAHSVPVPASGLLRGARTLVEPPASPAGWFVKPNRLGAKIGIWEDSRARSPDEARSLAVRIHEHYGDDALVQAYAPGVNVRVSFLDVDGKHDMGRLGIYAVDAGGDFQTMADSLDLYRAGAGRTNIPRLDNLDVTRPRAAARIRGTVARLADGLGLRQVFSCDLRLHADNRLALLEFEVSPGLPSYDFRAYCDGVWGLTLAEAMAEAAARALLPR